MVNRSLLAFDSEESWFARRWLAVSWRCLVKIASSILSISLTTGALSRSVRAAHRARQCRKAVLRRITSRVCAASARLLLDRGEQRLRKSGSHKPPLNRSGAPAPLPCPSNLTCRPPTRAQGDCDRRRGLHQRQRHSCRGYDRHAATNIVSHHQEPERRVTSVWRSWCFRDQASPGVSFRNGRNGKHPGKAGSHI